jgi:hypothetical protein
MKGVWLWEIIYGTESIRQTQQKQYYAESYASYSRKSIDKRADHSLDAIILQDT